MKKNRIKNKWDRQRIDYKMVELNLIIFINILNINELNILI